MSTVSELPRSGEWTVDDLATLPDDGLQYELLDGVLLVSPAPRLPHQRAAGRLDVLLANAHPTPSRSSSRRWTSNRPDAGPFSRTCW